MTSAQRGSVVDYILYNQVLGGWHGRIIVVKNASFMLNPSKWTKDRRGVWNAPSYTHGINEEANVVIEGSSMGVTF